MPAGGAQSIVTASSGDQYITTTWANAPTDPKKVTIAYWERFAGTPAVDAYAFTTAASSGVFFDHKLNGSSRHYVISDDIGGVYNLADGLAPTPDTNWHHICIQIDTTQVTPVHFWIDGADVGTSGTQPALNSNMRVTANTIASFLGTVSYNLTNVTDAKFAYVYLIDGQALTPSSFTTGTGGSIHPITYTGTYGTNGFFLNGNGGSLTDQGPYGIVWTAPNGISYSADLPT